MELETKRQKLITVAKGCIPSTKVPYAFEKRIMAQLRGMKLDPWAFWERALWKAAAGCAALVLVLAVFDQDSAPQTEDLSVAIQNTVYAAVQESIPGSL